VPFSSPWYLLYKPGCDNPMQSGEPHGPTDWLHGRVLRVETEEMIKSDVSGRMPGNRPRVEVPWFYEGRAIQGQSNAGASL
jgi:hypothetical protein